MTLSYHSSPSHTHAEEAASLTAHCTLYKSSTELFTFISAPSPYNVLVCAREFHQVRLPFLAGVSVSPVAAAEKAFRGIRPKLGTPQKPAQLPWCCDVSRRAWSGMLELTGS